MPEKNKDALVAFLASLRGQEETGEAGTEGRSGE